MTGKPILLKALLRQRHLQTHRAFCREYDKLAEKADKQLVGGWPSKAQFYRWLSGDLVGLPYADHCLILETMFPDWKVEQLFEPHNGGIEYIPQPPQTRQTAQPSAVKTPVADPSSQHVGDIVAAYASRSEFAHDVPPRQLFDGAQSIRMVGLSLNMLVQQYPDKALLQLLEAGTTAEFLFLDPNGRHITMREQEESHTPGTLSTLTDVNIRTMQRLGTKLSDDAQGNLRIRTYDEIPRYNITIINDTRCIVQPYLPDARGVESPTLVLEQGNHDGGMYETFAQVFTSMWERATEVTA